MSTESMIAETPPNDGREWDSQCARCGSSMDRVRCDSCGGDGWHEDVDGVNGSVDHVDCDICSGRGDWKVCMSSDEWCRAHPLPGREHIEPSTVEWFTHDAKVTA